VNPVTRCFGLLTVLLIPLVTLLPGGCPNQGTGTPWSGGELRPGPFWVDYDAGGLFCYALPCYRGDTPGKVDVPEDAGVPAWYQGPAVYEHAEDGTWTLTGGVGQTLDAVIQTWDPIPTPEGPAPA
jgi:hypothetical protein